MSEEERKAKRFPLHLPIPPAFDQEVINYSLSKKFSKLVVSDAPYGSIEG
jgi:hypothetical protein